MGSDNHHPFDLPDPPAGSGREQAIRKAVAAFDEKYSPSRQVFHSETRLRSSTENGSGRSRRGIWMKRGHLALAASIAVLVISPVVVMRSGMLDQHREGQVASSPPAPAAVSPEVRVAAEQRSVADGSSQKPADRVVEAPPVTVTKEARAPEPGLAERWKQAPEALGRSAASSMPSAPAPAPAPAPARPAPMAAPLASAQHDPGYRARGSVSPNAYTDIHRKAEPPGVDPQEQGRDRFDVKPTNGFKVTQQEPVSTFSVDVDTASYSFMRASLARNALPQQGSVRTEELVNYFPYDYPLPEGASEPFRTTASVFPSPWAAGRKIVHIGIKGYAVQAAERPRANIVLLVDVSGSMNQPNRLPLLKQSLAMLASSLDPRDTVAIVTYAGDAGTVLEPTPVSNKQAILGALERLSAGGSTAGAEGIRQAYVLAERNFDPKGVNRVILATDGDFNVGITNQEELKSFIARKRETGIFLSVLGFGMGNYNDALMQTLAQNGNGAAAYIDTLNEARKVLVEEATSSIIPIAKDVKIQVEFNPATVSEYRLIGYETRLLQREDFNNDKVDAGDVGSGHSVTALYEIVPAGGPATMDALRYGQQGQAPSGTSGELAFVKLRYKLPQSDTSLLMTTPVDGKASFGRFEDAPQEARFATAVAGFGELLRGGQHNGRFTYDDVLRLASAARGEDPFGYRSEFLQLVRAARTAR
jgi:Ca-activated chloride channel family protein